MRPQRPREKCRESNVSSFVLLLEFRALLDGERHHCKFYRLLQLFKKFAALISTETTQRLARPIEAMGLL
jgi:hypothetical protein